MSFKPKSLEELKHAVRTYMSGDRSYGEMNSWDVSLITSLEYLFSPYPEFNEYINDWNTTNVTIMTGVFKDTKFNQVLDKWNTSNVIQMDYMFSGATKFNQNINMWNTSNVGMFKCMFENAHSFNQPLDTWIDDNGTKHWYTGYAGNMSGMFSNATSFNQPLNNWDTQYVMFMDEMFKGAISFNQPLDNWNTIEVVNMDNMFEKAYNFKQDISNWNVSNVTHYNEIFRGATSMPREFMPKFLHSDKPIYSVQMKNPLYIPSRSNKDVCIDTSKDIDINKSSITIFMLLHGGEFYDELLENRLIKDNSVRVLSVASRPALYRLGERKTYSDFGTSYIESSEPMLYNALSVFKNNPRRGTIENLLEFGDNIRKHYSNLLQYVVNKPNNIDYTDKRKASYLESFKRSIKDDDICRIKSAVYEKTYGMNKIAGENDTDMDGIYIVDYRLPPNGFDTIPIGTNLLQKDPAQEAILQEKLQGIINNLDVSENDRNVLEQIIELFKDDKVEILLSMIIFLFKTIGFEIINIIDTSCRGCIAENFPPNNERYVRRLRRREETYNPYFTKRRRSSLTEMQGGKQTNKRKKTKRKGRKGRKRTTRKIKY